MFKLLLVFLTLISVSNTGISAPQKFNWTLKLASFNDTNTVKITPISEDENIENPILSFETRSPGAISYSISKRGLGFSYSEAGEFDEEEALTGELETETTMFSAFYDFLKLSTEVFLVDQTGYILQNPGDLFTGWDSTAMNPQFPDMRVQTSGVSVFYTSSNSDYSISEITSQTERITKDVGFSWIAGIQAKRTLIKNIPVINVDVNSIGEVAIDDISIATLTPFGGFGFRWSYNDFYVAPALMLGRALVKDFSSGSKGVSVNNMASKAFIPFGYHSDKFFIGINLLNDGLPITQETNEVQLDRLHFEAFIGGHF